MTTAAKTRGRKEHQQMPEVPEELAEMRKLIGRAMSRVNKLKVAPSVRQEQLLTDAKDYLMEALEAFGAYEDRLMDEEWE